MDTDIKNATDRRLTTMPTPEHRQHDHDAIIRVETKIENICATINKMDAKLDKQLDTCSCRITDCSKRFVNSRMFYWTVGLIISSIIFIGGIGLSNKSYIDIRKHVTHQEQIHREPVPELPASANMAMAQDSVSDAMN